MSKKKAATKSKPASNGEPSVSSGTPEVKSMQFWLTVARSLVPKEKDDWKLMEIATTLRLQTALLADNWNEINRIAAKVDDKITITWNHKIDRSNMPPTVKVTGAYSEKHPMKAESDVADPNQNDLPGLQATQEAAEADANAEHEEQPRVTAGEPVEE